jgi:hypothetical protein
MLAGQRPGHPGSDDVSGSRVLCTMISAISIWRRTLQPSMAHWVGRAGHTKTGGAGGIRTLDRALQPYNGLANRRLQPLGHSSIRADMPDAGASRKRQISSWRIPGGLTTAGTAPESGSQSCLLILRPDGGVTDLPHAGRKYDAASPRTALRIFRAHWSRAVVWGRRAICAEWLKNFARWNSIYRSRCGRAGCASAIMAALFRGNRGALFPVLGARFGRRGRVGRAKPPRRSPRTNPHSGSGYFKTSKRNNDL